MTSYITDQTPAGDFEKITVSSSAIGVTSSKLLVNQVGGFHKRPVRAFITVETNTVRFRFDGTDPTTITGHAAGDGAYITIDGEENVRRLKFIAAGSNATIQVTLFYNI